MSYNSRGCIHNCYHWHGNDVCLTNVSMSNNKNLGIPHIDQRTQRTSGNTSLREVVDMEFLEEVGRELAREGLRRALRMEKDEEHTKINHVAETIT